MFSKNKKLLYYGTSLTGSSHIARGICCQDAHKAVHLNNGWLAAAVADGVGSCKFSDKASKIAVETFTEYCEKSIKTSLSVAEIKDVIKGAFATAQRLIEMCAENDEQPVTEYDTTLSAVIYDGEKTVYGHSGDGGIIGLANDGRFIKITSPQKGEDNICVIPLRAGEEHWVIDECSEKLAGVLLATDGVYDTFFPYLLKGQPNEIYVLLTGYFLDNNLLKATGKNIGEIGESRKEFLESPSYAAVTDDKTVLVCLNPNVKPGFQPDEYYEEPDWEKLQLEWNRKAYPHLYAQNSNAESASNAENAEGENTEGATANVETASEDGNGNSEE